MLADFQKKGVHNQALLVGLIEARNNMDYESTHLQNFQKVRYCPTCKKIANPCSERLKYLNVKSLLIPVANLVVFKMWPVATGSEML